jgi:hypothetical protein
MSEEPPILTCTTSLGLRLDQPGPIRHKPWKKLAAEGQRQRSSRPPTARGADHSVVLSSQIPKESTEQSYPRLHQGMLLPPFKTCKAGSFLKSPSYQSS